MTRSHDGDIITGLPEPLIHQIFSFLPTIDAVRMTLLSRAWRDRWRSSPFLSFIGSDFEDAQSFCLFIDAVLLIREPISLHTFRLTVEWYETDLPLFNEWIQHAVSHRVRELFLDLAYKDYRVMLPSCIFSCKTLEKFSLKTFYWTKFQPPVSVALDGLRILRFYSIELEAVDLKKILAGCSVLEELHLQSCVMNTPTFSAQRLKLLKIVDCDIFVSITIASNPSLEELVFSNNYSTNIVGTFSVLLEKLPSLAFCTIYHESYFSWEGVLFKGDDGLSKKLNYLEISLPDMEVFLEIPISFFTYPCTLYNLKHLKLHIYLNNRSIELVNELLTCTPNLETFVIMEIKDPDYKDSEESILDYIKLPAHLHSVDVVPLTPLQMGMNLQSGCFYIKRKLKSYHREIYDSE